MDCNTCKEKINKQEPVPFMVHQTDMARMDRANKRMLWIVIILVLALIGTNAGWLYYESQFETVTITQEVEQDADNGENHFIGGDFYGKTEGEDYYD